MQSSRSNGSSDSGSSSGHEGREELVQLTVPDSDESFTMRYPAGIPVKLQLNGGTFQRILSFGRKSKNVNIEDPIAYGCVRQRQQQVHAQLQYAAGQLDHSDRRTSAEYHHRSNGYPRREMAGVWVNYDLSMARWELLLAALTEDGLALSFSNCSVKHCCRTSTSKEALATMTAMDNDEWWFGRGDFFMLLSHS
jgi:hypothetical protein